MSEDSIGMRRRVAQACDNCRSLKAKCDGRAPVCSRCHGYGYKCTWSNQRKRTAKENLITTTQPPTTDSAPPTPTTPRSNDDTETAVKAYEKLIQNLCVRLPTRERAAVNVKLSCIRQRLPAELSDSIASLTPSDVGISETPIETSFCDRLTPHSERYFGEASDVQFYNSVKSVLQRHLPSSRLLDEETNESYDQATPTTTSDVSRDISELPKKELADAYIGVYFSTIHLAYPFVDKVHFMDRYETLWGPDELRNFNHSWLGLLYSIFAIGSYYLSFPSSENPEHHSHAQYAQQARLYLGQDSDFRDLIHIRTLLAQCFYFLAVCQTNRCWTTLGIAIRIGQSNGLHIEWPEQNGKSQQNARHRQMRRRAWYSMYVLDRLLALQLGRPTAIYESDHRVDLPTWTDDQAYELERSGQLESPVPDDRGQMEYFIAVIRLSKIIGDVMHDIYNVTQPIILTPRLLSLIRGFDAQLLAWKIALPRFLRFDLGHTFEKSIDFQRQRNMLAIKFHHLRALIHRPFLCPGFLPGSDVRMSSLSPEDQAYASRSQQICVSEARSTAHLLHKVPDERSLVQDFPWWQMIPCLICASSILLVASTCTTLDVIPDEASSYTLDEDAETCLKVFEALSVNSEAARMARDMMKGLKEARFRFRRGTITGKQDQVSSIGNKAIEDNTLDPDASASLDDLGSAISYGDVGIEPMEYSYWPCEISDSMTWSAQFVDASHNLFPRSL